jgi:outer membrane receptor protein involved in Fe transport
MRLSAFTVLSLWGSALLLAPPLSAQLSTAAINGTVRDASGSLVPQVEVILRNVNTGVERTTLSNDAGNYVLQNVQPGRYTLEASKPGFSTARLEPFDLAVNQTATQDFSLQVGSIGQSVTVEAVGTELQASTAELGAVVSQKEVIDLPLNGRHFTQLLLLSPGVSPINVGQNAGGQNAAVGRVVMPSINGQTGRSNLFLLDGVLDYGGNANSFIVAPIVDSIQEFKIQSHNDLAEFGGVLGGMINVVTRAGTNAFHGSAWEFLRNDAFDARNFFQASVTPFRWNQFGASGGGPILIPKVYNGKNRTFFFLSYQGYRLRQPANSYFRVPTDANLQGDLSDWPRQIYNPFTTRPDPANPGQFIRDPFPGNRIPANLIDPGTLLYAQATLPKPIFTGLSDRNALDTTPFRQSQEEYSARGDHTINSKNFVWFRYSGRQSEITSSGGRPALGTSSLDDSRNIGASWVSTFSPSSVLQVQFGNNRQPGDTITRFTGLSAGFVDQVGFSSGFARDFVLSPYLIPGLNVTDFFTGGENYNSCIEDNYQYKADWSKTHGSHTFKMGGEVVRTGYRCTANGPSATFSAFQTADPQNPGSTGSPLASFLLNVPDNATRRNTTASLEPGHIMGFYFQDQWKATPKLTLNLGLRYDRTFFPKFGKPEDNNTEVGDIDFNRGVYVLQKGVPSCAQRGQAPCIPGGQLPEHVVVAPDGVINHYSTKNFQPRIGLAYRLNARTALRASYGIFFDNWAGVQQTAQNIQGTWPTLAEQLAQNLNNPTPQQPAPTVKGTDPFAANASGLFPSPTPFDRVQWYRDPDIKNAYAMQWNFGVQFEVNNSTLVSANYVGSGSRRLNIGGYYNTALTPGPGNPRDRAPFPYITPTFYDRSWGRGNYNAFQFRMDKRFASGLSYIVSYTWSKAMSLACDGWFGVEGCSNQDPYNFNNDRSVTSMDLTHILTASWVYELPIGRGKQLTTGSRAADYILGNWQLNGIASLHSGQPYDVGIAGDIANTGNFNCCNNYYERLNVVGDPRLSNPTPEAWFNTNAFAAPARYTFGNLGRNALRSDGVVNFDLSVFRQFPLNEAAHLEFRAEAFNAFNHPDFGIPGRELSSPNFGRVLTLATGTAPRQLQLGMKLVF